MAGDSWRNVHSFWRRVLTVTVTITKKLLFLLFLVLAVTIGAASAAGDIDNYLAGYKLDNIIDQSLNNYDLTNNNAATFVTGNIGDAGKFVRASSQSLTVANDMGIGNGTISVSLWIKPASLPSVSASSCGSGNSYNFFYQGDSATFVNQYICLINDGGTQKISINRQEQNVANNDFKYTFTTPTGVYTHIIMTYSASSGTHSLYVNNVLQASGVTSGNGAGGTVFEGVQLGAELGVATGDSFFDGIIDSAYIYDFVLNSSERSTLYNGGVGKENPFSTTPTNTTWAYTGNNFSLNNSGSANYITSGFFDGELFYGLENSAKEIREYNKSDSFSQTPNVFDPTSEDSTGQGIASTGTNFYYAGSTTNKIYRYSKSWVYDGTNVLAGGSPRELAANTTNVWVALSNETIIEFDTSLVATGKQYVLSSVFTAITGLFFDVRTNEFYVSGVPVSGAQTQVYVYDANFVFTGKKISINEVGGFAQAINYKDNWFVLEKFNLSRLFEYEEVVVGDFSNYTTIQTANAFFNDTITIGNSFGIVASTDFEILNLTKAYFSASIGVDGGSGTAECRINIAGNTYNSTSQRSLDGNKGNFYLTSTLTSFSPNNYTSEVECRKVGGPNYNVITSSLTLYEMFAEHLTHGHGKHNISAEQFNKDNTLLTTTPTASNFIYTTGNNFNTSSTNELGVYINWRMDYSYGVGSSLVNTTVEFNNENCASYPRSGSNGEVGSVSGNCLVSGLLGETSYNLRVWGSDDAGTSTIQSMKLYVNELIQHQNSLQTKNIISKNITTRTLIAQINLSNVLGGNYNIYAKASINSQNNSASPTEGSYELEINGIPSGVYSRTYNGIGNVAFEDVVGATGLTTKTVSLYATCTNTCDVITGELTTFMTNAATASDNTMIVTAYDTYNSSQISVFNATIGGTTINTINGSLIIPTNGGIQTVNTESPTFFSNSTSQDTTTALNATLFRWTRLLASTTGGTTINNFSITFNNSNTTTTTGNVFIPLFSTTNETTIFDANEGGINYETRSVNITASPYLRNYTFILFFSNSFIFNFRNESNNQPLTNLNVTVELISSAFANNYTTNGSDTLNVTLLMPDTYEIRYFYDPEVPRNYFVTLTNQSVQNLTLYTIDKAVSNLYVVIEKDESENFCDKQTISMLRYFIDINGYRIVEMARTDTQGQGVFVVRPNIINYKFSFNGDCGLFVSDPAKLVDASNIYIVTEAQSVLTSLTSLPSISSSIDFINSTNTFTFSWADTSNIVIQGCLEIVQRVNGIRSIVSKTCSPGSSGSQIYSFNDTTGLYVGKGILSTNTLFSDVFVGPISIDFTKSWLLWGGTGLFIALLFSIGIILWSATGTTSIVVGSVASLALMAWLGFIYNAWTSIIGLMVLGVIIAYKARK